ncbi:MAG: hypothetical protein WCF18_04600 [Chthoniobacteraceae bacterium]
MKFLPLFLLAVFAAQADEMPATLMTTRGALLVEEAFARPLPPFDGKSNGFASGFNAWRYNTAQRGGTWTVENGTFKGVENPAVHHPATASRGFVFKDAVIQCEVRMHDVPLEGRASRYFMIRTTDTKDYVCSVFLNEKGWRIQKDDNDHGGPDKAVPLGQVTIPIPLGAWRPVVFEILGDEMVATVNGQSLTGQHPLIASEKHSVMFVAGVEGSVRNLKIWAAQPHPEWPKTRQSILAGQAGFSRASKQP